MRRSTEEKAETRQQILHKAGRLIRIKGLAETGVAEVMAAAGLTHGGFYRHFASKEDLTAAAIEAAFADVGSQLRARAGAAPPGRALDAVIDLYLTEAHRDRPDRGCVMAALGMEAPRAGGAVRKAYRDGIAGLLAIYADLIPAPTRRQQEDRAQALLAQLVGGLLLARALKDDPAASQRALQTAREAALKVAAG
ncbi:MAG TPA: TetR family transcriptional regulator [Alphaproteobacteria bacterium]